MQMFSQLLSHITAETGQTVSRWVCQVIAFLFLSPWRRCGRTVPTAQGASLPWPTSLPAPLGLALRTCSWPNFLQWGSREQYIMHHLVSACGLPLSLLWFGGQATGRVQLSYGWQHRQSSWSAGLRVPRLLTNPFFTTEGIYKSQTANTRAGDLNYSGFITAEHGLAPSALGFMLQTSPATCNKPAAKTLK